MRVWWGGEGCWGRKGSQVGFVGMGVVVGGGGGVVGSKQARKGGSGGL